MQRRQRGRSARRVRGGPANAEALCDEIAAAASYDEFRAARAKLDDYREAYRTQLGGEAYTEFLELCKESLNI